jgi:hypothetical protein
LGIAKYGNATAGGNVAVFSEKRRDEFKALDIDLWVGKGIGGVWYKGLRMRVK